ncbi:MAG: flagellar basal-body MS-ring/collar protein FliF [SAR324 cluster bacterium]|nr:flagellar basal-body MS-ring/collar protein FliF [SAR324 cluster bacterium]
MAEETANNFRDIVAQFQNFFENLTIAKRVILFSVLAVVLIGMMSLIYVANRESWTPLFSGISVEDAAQVKEKLDQGQIPVLVGPGGRSILVPTGMADEARILLAKERVVLGGGLGFADLFVGQSGIGETEFQQQVKFRIALEGELGRLINRLDNVKSVKVTLALPKKSVFLKDEDVPTASVVVEAAGGEKITRAQVDTIGHLVVNAVEGLAKSDVVVADTSGKVLTRGGDELGGANFSDQFAFRRRMEESLQNKIITQLEPVVGQDRVRARVAAELIFDKVTTKEEIFDPDTSVVRSEQTSTENTTGTRSIPVGIPGVTANLPETQAGASQIANVSQLARTNETRNFEISVKRIVSEPAVGRVQRLSVSVLIDGKYKPITDDSGQIVTRQYEEWSTAEKQEIQRLIKAAVGFNEKRGDVLEVINLRFRKAQEEDLTAQVEKTARNRQFFLDILRFTFLGVGLLALIMFVIRPMVQRLSAKPEDLDLLMGLPATIGELEGEELEIPTEHEVGIPPREKIMDMARSDPLATASMIRAWLRDKR